MSNTNSFEPVVMSIIVDHKKNIERTKEIC